MSSKGKREVGFVAPGNQPALNAAPKEEDFLPFENLIRARIPKQVLLSSSPQLRMMGITETLISITGISKDGSWLKVDSVPERAGIVPKIRFGVPEILDTELLKKQLTRLGGLDQLVYRYY